MKSGPSYTPKMFEPNQTRDKSLIIDWDDPILVTGSNGFIGSRVVETLLRYGFTNLRCFVRPSSNVKSLHAIRTMYPGARVGVLPGNLLSREDCARAVKD
ncbi:MAG: NAD-dependent epimerase/dehydratase family protein, partial [Gaiellaceae bacterium]